MRPPSFRLRLNSSPKPPVLPADGPAESGPPARAHKLTGTETAAAYVANDLRTMERELNVECVHKLGALAHNGVLSFQVPPFSHATHPRAGPHASCCCCFCCCRMARDPRRRFGCWMAPHTCVLTYRTPASACTQVLWLLYRVDMYSKSEPWLGGTTSLQPGGRTCRGRERIKPL